MRKRVLVTGGNRGLGRATAEKLARRGAAVVLTSRDPAKGEAAAAAIRSAVPGAAIETRVVDLASLESIRALTLDGPLDVLLNNAGVMQQSRVRRTTKDGFEETLGTNVLGPMLLTHRLLPALREAPSARVVNVSSRLHLEGSRGPEVRFDFDDPELERSYDPDVAYKNSKLAVMWFTYELARQLESEPIAVDAVCPGFVPTTAAASTKGLMRLLMRYVMPRMPFATSIERATDTFVYACLDPAIENVRGKLIAESRPIASSKASYDEGAQRRFWSFACAAIGVPTAWSAADRG